MFNQFMKQQIITVLNATTIQQQKKISMSIYRTLIKMQMAQKPLAIEAEKKKEYVSKIMKCELCKAKFSKKTYSKHMK